MARAKSSEFLTWFISQYGPAPTLSADEAMRRRNEAASAHGHAERLVMRIEEYETRRDAALKAWCAK